MFFADLEKPLPGRRKHDYHSNYYLQEQLRCVQEMEMKDFVKFCKNCKFVDSTLPPAVADAWQHLAALHHLFIGVQEVTGKQARSRHTLAQPLAALFPQTGQVSPPAATKADHQSCDLDVVQDVVESACALKPGSEVM